MDPDELESGLDNASNSSEEFDAVDDLNLRDRGAGRRDRRCRPADEELEAEPTAETDESDLPEYRGDDYSAEERERLAALWG